MNISWKNGMIGSSDKHMQKTLVGQVQFPSFQVHVFLYDETALTLDSTHYDNYV